MVFLKQDGVRVERFAQLVEGLAVIFRDRRCECQEDLMELAELLVRGLEGAHDSTLLRERSEMVE